MKICSKFLAYFAFLHCVTCAKNSNLLYNGDNKVFLSLTKPFQVDILQDGKLQSRFELPNAADSTVSGTASDISYSLDVSSTKEIQGTDGTLTQTRLKFDMELNKKSG